MNSSRHRALPGVLALVCFLTILINAFPIQVMSRQAFANTGPDLTIVSISLSPEAPALGNTVTFTTTVKNEGDSPAPPSRIDYYIDDNLIGTDYFNTIVAGDIAVKTFAWLASARDHIIKVIIDSDNVIAETNEENNENIRAFSILAADLIIESITWSPQTASVGDTVTYTVKVKNRGNKIAGDGWVEFLIDDIPRGQREYGRLEPDESTSMTYNWITQEGVHNVKATADFYKQSIESDETNNDLIVAYTTAPPDLIIYSILWSPTNRVDTENVTMHVTVKNKGSGTARGSWIDFYIDGTQKSSIFIDSLSAGAIDTRTYTWTAGPNEHILRADIDADNWIYESNESNNTLSVTLPAVYPPDLLVQSITWTPAQPTVNSWMTYTITVKNAGSTTVGTCYLDFYIGHSTKMNRKLGPIAPGGTASVSLQYFTSTAPFSVRAIVDPDNYVDESDETNNEKATSITPVEPTPTFDFYVTSLTCTSQNPVAGQEITIITKIKNNGSKQSPESHLAYYIDGIMVDTVLIKKLSARNTVTNNITWIATPGKHTIRVVADYNDSYLEISELNNAKEIVITTLSSDLTIKSITWSPEIPEKGDALDITFTITNQGTYKSNGCYISYYVDGTFLGTHYIEEIAPGGTDTRTFPWTLTNDFQSFKVIIDEENNVMETDESNNEKTAVIPAPDLLIESITYSPTEFSENSTAVFTILIRNTGVTSAESSYLDCYVNNVFQVRLPVLTLSADTSTEVLFNWTALPGENVLKVILDGADSIVEVNETNNEKSISVQTIVPVIELIPPPEQPVEETTDNVTANETQENTIPILDTDDTLPPQENEIPSSIPATVPDDISELFSEDTSLWQNILGNRWLIIGVAVVGAAAISVLLMIRKRSQAY